MEGYFFDANCVAFLQELGDIFDLEDIPMVRKRKHTFCSDYGIDIQKWFDMEFQHHAYEKVALDVDSAKEAARKARYPEMTSTETILILGLLRLENEMPAARQYYFEKQWQAIAMSYRRKEGSLVPNMFFHFKRVFCTL